MGNVFKKQEPGGAPSQEITNSNKNAKPAVLTKPVVPIVTSPEIQSLQAKSNQLRQRIESASNANKPALETELNNVQQKINSLQPQKINGGRSKKSKRKRRKSVRR